MSCCGKNRQALKSTRISVTRNPRPPLSTRLAYQGESNVLLRGPSTGRSYWFTPETREQEVDARDLTAMIATGLFGAK
jgi:hypothetical protein